MLCRSKSCVRVCAMAVAMSMGILIFSPAVQATVITPMSATADSTYSVWAATNLINGSGMSGSLTGAPGVFHCRRLIQRIHLSIRGLRTAQNTGTITFDLGADYNLASAHVWNHNAETYQYRGIKDVVISVASAAAPTTWTAAYTGQLAEAIGVGDTGC